MYVFALFSRVALYFLTGNTSDIWNIQVPKHNIMQASKEILKTKICKWLDSCVGTFKEIMVGFIKL